MNEKRLLCEARKVAANDMQSAATREWDFDRQGVHAGHYFMENYEAAKQDFAVRAGLVESQRLFSDEQIAVIKMPASLRWRTTRHSRMPRKSSSTVCRSRSSCFCRRRTRSSAPQWNRQCNIRGKPGFQKSRLFCVQGGIL